MDGESTDAWTGLVWSMINNGLEVDPGDDRDSISVLSRGLISDEAMDVGYERTCFYSTLFHNQNREICLEKADT